MPRITRHAVHNYYSTPRVQSISFVTHQTTASVFVCRREPVVRSGSQQIFRHSYWPDALHDLCSGKAATKQLFKAMSDAELREHYGLQEAQLHQLARHGNRPNGHPSSTRACTCRSRSMRRYARSRLRSASKSTTSCWRGSIWHCGGVGMRRLRASRLGKSDRAAEANATSVLVAREHLPPSEMRPRENCLR
jgi:hypothetical protein